MECDILLNDGDIGVKGFFFFNEIFQIVQNNRLFFIIRVWWILAVLLSIYFCGSSIRDILIDWQENPVKMGFTDRPELISAIPFPTVTICPTG